MGTLHEEKLVHLFTSPIIKHEWARSQALNRELSASIVKHARTTGGEHNMAIGGWQSSKDYHKWAGKRDRVLLNRIAESIKQATQLIHDIYRHEEDHTEWSIAMWSNVYSPGDYHRNHCHPGSTWSGIYFVDPGNPDPNNAQSGAVALINPNLGAPMSFYRAAIPMRYIIHPEPGLMVMWPSYILQMVHPYTGRRPRITVSFNVHKDPYP